MTRDIWLRSKDGKHTKLTTFGGEDRNAVWDSKGGFYYLSEREGSFNVYHRDAATAAAADKKITSFTKNPVRFLSIASNGTLCYGFDGEIYTQTPGGQPTKVNVSIVRDQEESAINPETIRDGVSSFAVAPSNKEIAFIVTVMSSSLTPNTARQSASPAPPKRSVMSTSATMARRSSTLQSAMVGGISIWLS